MIQPSPRPASPGEVPADHPAGPAAPICSRRRMLLGTAATAAGALLAACAPKASVEKVAAADIPTGSGLVVGDYVVTHPEEGTYHAFSARCPHQGGRISEFADGTMVCPDHGSHFDMATGDVVSGPSREPAAAAPLSVENGDTLVVGGEG